MPISQISRHPLAALLLLAVLPVRAAPVTIDFEEPLSPIELAPGFITLDSQGYSFDTAVNNLAQITADVSSQGIFAQGIRASTSPAGATINMTRTDNGAFAIHSLVADYLGQSPAYFAGTLWGGGAANLGSPIGTGDWLNLVQLSYTTFGTGAFFDPTAVRLDNITVSAVPIPAAAWLFASGLGALAWIRRRKLM